MTFKGPLPEARRALQRLDVVQRIDTGDQSLTVSVSDGPSAISPQLSRFLERRESSSKSSSLRRPSLDDVFLSVTGERIATRNRAAIPVDADRRSTTEPR